MQRASGPLRAPRGSGRADWLIPPLVLLALGGAFVFVRLDATWIFGWVFGGLVALVVGWVMVSVLWPARADRGCPVCGADAVERIDPRSTVGRRCRACGWRDDSESAWLLAEEEEDALEEVVLRQRRGKGRPRPLDRPSASD